MGYSLRADGLGNLILEKREYLLLFEFKFWLRSSLQAKEIVKAHHFIECNSAGGKIVVVL